jgi:hypothetical protein
VENLLSQCSSTDDAHTAPVAAAGDASLLKRSDMHEESSIVMTMRAAGSVHPALVHCHRKGRWMS